MNSDRRLHRASVVLTLAMLISLACSFLPPLPLRSEEELTPTRTPLPTFTATATLAAFVSVLPTPTETSALPPTETPTPVPDAPPESPPTETPVPEPTVTETPVPPSPTSPPPPPPTGPPPPTEPAQPVAQNGVVGKISFRDGRNTYGVGEKVFVTIEATNVESGLKPFGILGLTPSTGTFQTSWDNGSIAAGETFRHEDGLAFGSPGTHKLWLSICFSSKEVCQGPNGEWVRFEPGLDVIVQ